jgi:hypothetical protein
MRAARCFVIVDPPASEHRRPSRWIQDALRRTLTVVPIAMNRRQRVLSAIAHPNVAFILLSLGTLGLTIELWSAGAVLPVVAGGLCLSLLQIVRQRESGAHRGTHAGHGRRFREDGADFGMCGAGFIMMGKHRLGCFGARDQGRCDNHLTIRRDEVEARVLTALQDKLLRQDLFEEFCDEFTREMNRLRMEHRAGLSAAEREIERIESRRKKLVESIMEGVPASEVKDELNANAARRGN